MQLRNWEGKKVLVTGHTGFKGSWLCRMLLLAGAEVTGYALPPQTQPALFTLCGLEGQMDSVEGDVRDLERLLQVFQRVRPEYVLHLAAQPIVRESYRNPVYTYEVNVMGTVHVMECVRRTPSVRSVVNVTTDKVYRNREWDWGYRENEELNGYDPYSNSKSCSELVTDSYRKSFFAERGLPVSTARAGNVIGGGDFAPDRIVPDCIRAAEAGREIVLRNPDSIRPYQHVLEPVYAYLLLALAQAQDPSLAGCYNIGPAEENCITTGEVAALFCRQWQRQTGQRISWRAQREDGPHEATFLKLDCSKARARLGYRPLWNMEKAMEQTVAFAAAAADGHLRECMDSQIALYWKEADREK